MVEVTVITIIQDYRVMVVWSDELVKLSQKLIYKNVSKNYYHQRDP